VSVRAERNGDCATICVADEGPGVPEDFRPFLFHEYAHRNVDDGSSPQPGIGLGLAIVRRLAEAHGGEVWFRANEPRGAIFGIRLPLA
jgi:signal transduction histidine kinase